MPSGGVHPIKVASRPRATTPRSGNGCALPCSRGNRPSERHQPSAGLDMNKPQTCPPLAQRISAPRWRLYRADHGLRRRSVQFGAFGLAEGQDHGAGLMAAPPCSPLRPPEPGQADQGRTVSAAARQDLGVPGSRPIANLLRLLGPEAPHGCAVRRLDMVPRPRPPPAWRTSCGKLQRQPSEPTTVPPIMSATRSAIGQSHPRPGALVAGDRALDRAARGIGLFGGQNTVCEPTTPE